MKLVTGGTSLLGREIVSRLDDVLVHYYTNKELAESLSPHTIYADLSTKDGVAGFLDGLGELDVIINNLGFYDETGWSLDKWERMFRTNVILPALLSTHISSGVIINITSIIGHPWVDGRMAYGASKAALNKFSDTFTKPGVRINAIAPAAIPMSVSAAEVADEVLRVINDESINNQVIYLWGNAPEYQKNQAKLRSN